MHIIQTEPRRQQLKIDPVFSHRNKITVIMTLLEVRIVAGCTYFANWMKSE